MELDYKDPDRRGKFLVVLGVILALVAGGAAFIVVNQATQQAGQGGVQKVAVVVAVQTIPARKIIEEADVIVREVPIDPTNEQGIVSTLDKVLGRVSAVSILQNQLVTTNLLASSTAGGQFTILAPEETVQPDSPEWRAVSLTVPDDRAVGGLLEPNQLVDVFATVTVNVLLGETADNEEGYYTDKSTKLTYQGMLVLARAGTFYVLRAPLAVAEEISHLQASGTASFSMVLRPDIDTRSVDAAPLGTTTNELIVRYGLPIPVAFPPAEGPLPTVAPVASPSAAPDASASPSASPTP
jgi:Flp pilus assembly protein CpaB